MKWNDPSNDGGAAAARRAGDAGRVPSDSSSPTSADTPSEGDGDPRVFRAIQEYLAALDAGRRPNRQELLARHPEVAAELSDALDGLAFVHSAAAKMIAPAAPPAADQLDPSVHGGEGATGRPLGDFQLVKEIGRGGMGVVYEAIQLSLGRRVAVKVLPMAAAFDERHLQRFHNEAQAAAQLHHTNIVPVYAVGCERGVHFYAMQLIEGQSLDTVIRELRFAARGGVAAPSTPSTAETIVRTPAASAPVAESPSNVPAGRPARPRHRPRASLGSADVPAYATPGGVPSDSLTGLRASKRLSYFQSVARLGLQAAEALEYAHRLGVVHRDIKPANLMLDVRGNLWVTDFGLAQLYAESNLTQTGDLLGTLRYMSPEQASGKAVVLDQRADIYSLGATLYELLTLERAVLGDTREQLLRELSTADPRPPRSLDKSIPVELDTILMKATAKSPADRYPSCAALAEDLRRFLNDEPILARPPSLLDKAIKWTRRHRSVAVSALVVLVLAATGLAVATILIAREQAKTKTAYIQEQARAKEATEQRALAERSFQQARAAVDFYTNLAATEMNDGPFRDLRKRMMEVGLDYYQGFLDERGNDPTISGELAAARSRVAAILSGLEAFDDFGRSLSRVRLLSEPAVRTELKLTDEQVRQVSVVAEKFAITGPPGAPGGFGKRGGGPGGKGFGGGPGGPPAEPDNTPAATEKRRAELATQTSDAEAALRQALTPAQGRRLRQVAWQVWGPMAFSDPEVVAALKLTSAQKDVVATVQGPFRDMRRMFRGRGGPRDGGGSGGRGGADGGGSPAPDGQTTQDAKDATAKIVAALTPTQKQSWSDLIGEPFAGAVAYTNPSSTFFVTFLRDGGGPGREDHHGPGGPHRDLDGPDQLDWLLDTKPLRKAD